jgi:hypothetical protein
MHGLGGSSPHRIDILPDLKRDIDKSNHDANRADDLSEIRDVVEIHTLCSRESVKLLNR